MALHVRPARSDDLARVQELVATGSRGMYAPDVVTELPRWWSEALRARRLELHVLEDDRHPRHQRIRIVASGGFLSDAAADQIRAAYVHGVAERLVRAELAGEQVLLDRRGQAASNSGGGVNAIGIDFACAEPDWSVLGLARWTPLLLDSLRMWLAGWKLRLGMREAIGRDLSLLLRATGAPLIRAADARTRLAPRDRRYLHGMTREQAARLPVSLQALLFFSASEPRYRFSPAEQELLVLAVRNHRDDECATELGISLQTVKMRWRSIFERLAEAPPDGFPDVDREDGKRGTEKRRHLLAYLAKHPEELRPRSK